jgi:hypothetical protein
MGTIQQSGLADRPEAIILYIFLNYIHDFTCLIVPRSVDYEQVAMMHKNTRETRPSHASRK